MKAPSLLKKTVVFGVVGSSILLAPVASEALTVQEVTNPRNNNAGWVSDTADILSDRTETELNSLITKLERVNGAEIAVVTVPETTPAKSPKAFATELFNYWGIGKAEVDNGILFLISIEDRRVEIETGYGTEEILPNSEVSKIIDNKITTQYKKGNFNRGTLEGTKALITALEPNLIKDNNRSWNIWHILSGLTSVSLIGGTIWRIKRQGKVFIEPHQNIVSLDRWDNRDVHCAKCDQAMEKVANIKLTKAQQVAKKIGSVSYRGYKCASCNSEAHPYSTITCLSPSSRYQNCPDCHELTVIRTKETLKPATRTSKGKLLVKDACNCCNYTDEYTETIPRLRPKNRNSAGGGSSNTIFGGYGGGGSFSSGGGGGGFGGGSSGGGGAGGSW